jgi:hypothetical protein
MVNVEFRPKVELKKVPLVIKNSGVDSIPDTKVEGMTAKDILNLPKVEDTVLTSHGTIFNKVKEPVKIAANPHTQLPDKKSMRQITEGFTTGPKTDPPGDIRTGDELYFDP